MRYPVATVAYARYSWSGPEPAERGCNFSLLDDVLEAYEKNGRDFLFRIMLDDSEDDACFWQTKERALPFQTVVSSARPRLLEAEIHAIHTLRIFMMGRADHRCTSDLEAAGAKFLKGKWWFRCPAAFCVVR